jgi:hypothetical protein
MRVLLFGLSLCAPVFAGTLVCAAAASQGAPVLPGSVSDWRLSEVGGKIACTLTFTRQTSTGGFELKAPLACRRAFPPLQAVAAWALDEKGGIVLSDAQAKPIIVFPEESDGAYEAKAPDGRTWRLEPIKEAPAPPPATAG